MRYVITALVCWLWVGNLFAQKEDYVWLTGYESRVGYDSVFNYYFGITQFDFNQNPVAITRDSLGMNFDRCIASISDSAGNLLFYSNGMSIRKRWDEKVENGDSLMWDTFNMHGILT